MTIKPIRNDDDLQAMFSQLEQVFQAQEGTPEADEMEVLVTFIEAYENRHYPIGPADPVEAIGRHCKKTCILFPKPSACRSITHWA
ncbi:hypothetical protein BN874_2750003 [Candidatus Contendobacter odensis Run_B_J11]|uniref:Transcriptional regulator n=1 Tax=Candidatus Contendobacter odensis Run_B_J11 TaxID=1400861 RepID=A0A7U7J4T8_9GAMM|nr:hypothetical protein BN874_2750003 [Candidatus Contendobacter odensis Run_B_J11]